MCGTYQELDLTIAIDPYGTIQGMFEKALENLMQRLTLYGR
jgi:hypothetical protein